MFAPLHGGMEKEREREREREKRERKEREKGWDGAREMTCVHHKER
jgi:hypothetical protein